MPLPPLLLACLLGPTLVSTSLAQAADWDNKDARFVPLARQPRTPVPIKLKRIDEHNAHLTTGERPIRYQAFKTPSGGLEFDLYDLDRPRFGTVAGLYGHHTRTAFRPGVSNYQLIDFMPPLVQALKGHALEYGMERVPAINAGRTGPYGSPNARIDEVVNTSTNCFSTAMELAHRGSFVAGSRAPSKLTVFFADRFRTPEIFNRCGELVCESSSPSQLGRLKTGDVLLFQTEQQLRRNVMRALNGTIISSDPGSRVKLAEHAATFIDEGLVFEKQNAGDRDPYRFVSLTEAARPYQQPGKSRVQAFRFSRPLASAQELLGGTSHAVQPSWRKPLPDSLRSKVLLNEEIIFPDEGSAYNTWGRAVDVPLARDPRTGRFRLGAAAFNPATFKINPHR